MGKRKAAAAGPAAQDVETGQARADKLQKGEKGQPVFRNKEKVLLLGSRGITHRFRHLMLDFAQLLPHCKRDAKLDTKTDRGVINEVADMKGCSSAVFFEVRKRKDLYVWIAKSPDGPSVKFHVENVHTMAELKLSGNHLRGSRPVLSFDAGFEAQPHLQLLKELLTQVFQAPRKHQRIKPFFDHVLSFHWADGRVWLRNYQVVPGVDKKKATPDNITLVEVGPRCCMNPIKVLAGSFGGPVLFNNPTYVSPNKVRALVKAQRAGKYGRKIASKAKRRKHADSNRLPPSEFADVFR